MTNTITLDEFAAFKAKTVEIALAAAKYHGLCEVVQRTLCKAGLADQLPPSYRVYAKYSPEQSWEDAANDYTDLEAAQKAAQRVRKEGIARVKSNAKYQLDYNMSTFNLNITRLSVEEAKARVEKAVKDYQLKKRQVTGEDTSYPKVKIVKRVWQDSGRQKSETVETLK